ncbi:MAG: hypothetical protein COB85_08195 [Bacteroidetes bacterium]|nr:MAG: hypothetical protein COB85_08195 [Bacteroidota bacterium]
MKYNIKLNIVGDGSEKTNLISLAKKLNVSGQIKFLGMKSRLDVRSEIEKCHSLVSSSKLETFGINIIEALACGKPVVATDSGGPNDIIREQDGIIVRDHSADQLANGMRTMIDNYHNYNSSEISKACIDRYSDQVISRKLNKLYEDILRK